jgi:hypothetical protein
MSNTSCIAEPDMVLVWWMRKEREVEEWSDILLRIFREVSRRLE